MIVCPNCGGSFASPHDISAHEAVNPRGIWTAPDGDHISQCEAKQRQLFVALRIEEESRG